MTNQNAPLSAPEIDAHLDAILRASGSALRNYSLPGYLESMRAAVRAVASDAVSKLHAPVARPPVCAPTWEEVKEANSVLASYSWNSNGEGGGVTATERKLAAALLRVAGVDWNPNGDPVYALRTPVASIQTLVDEKVDPKYWAESLRLRALESTPGAGGAASGMVHTFTGKTDFVIAEATMTRFCPGCGHVGDVADGHLDCCPDGSSARMVPKSIAEKCRAAFLLAIKPLRENASAPVAGEAQQPAKITFVNGNPASCGCTIRFSDGGGEYSDVHYVSLCGTHSGAHLLSKVIKTGELTRAQHEDLEGEICAALDPAGSQATNAAPQSSEAARDTSDMDDLRSRVLAAIHDCAALTPEDDESWDEWYCAAFDLLGSRVGEIFRVALSAQPANKPAISSPSSAGNPCPAPVPAYPETGNSHTDGGAVYG
ncbi:hypothetical protein C1I89_22440 [Achromobacter pulmonis]|uniref:Uncharacterized protein n=1 Tax=Achromobacter pulmonis TaxID=1389932 RepID=A0A2N8KDT2_9BURK|nr:hypothetical protein [Achromobacter pulmonis]PND31595.1 hypothetical protein C1I89_22440 [Achromobacter pulmonis]